MEIPEFLSLLEKLGIFVWVSDNKLRYSAVKGAVTPSIRQELIRRKTDIIAFLRANNSIVNSNLTAGKSAIQLARGTKVDQLASIVSNDCYRDIEYEGAAPHTPTERKLAKIWEQVLGVKQVKINDNFFELGGDSLLAMKIATRAQQQGLQFVPYQIMRHPTLAELASVEGQAVSRVDQEPITGSVSLTTGQHWFFDQEFLDPNRFNIVALFVVNSNLDVLLLRETIQYISAHHDALRARFKYDGLDWQQFFVAPSDVVPFDYIDFSGLPESEHKAAIEAVTNKFQDSLDLMEGLVFRIVLFNLGKDKPGRLLVILHHLLGDEVSLNILLEDIELAYKQLSRGENIKLPPKTASIKQWSERLNTFARSEELYQELRYWLNLPWSRVCPIPVDYPSGIESNTHSSRRIVTVALNASETHVLLRYIPAFYHASVTDALLMAIAQAVTMWTGGNLLPISVVDSGRGSVPNTEDLDVSRTMGWLASTRTMMLVWEETKNPGEALTSIMEQCRRIPNRGFGYEILYFCNRDPEIVQKLKPHIKQEVKLFYNGQRRKDMESESKLFKQAPEYPGANLNPQNKEYEPLLCIASIENDCLVANWIYSENLHKRITIDGVAQDFINALRALIEYCQCMKDGKRE